MKWTPENRLEAIRLRESGVSAREIGSMFGCTDDAVSAMIRRHGNPRPNRIRPTLSDEESATAVTMRQSGAALDVIARELRRDRAVVTRHLTSLGYGNLLTTWTPKMESTIREMWDAGSTCLDIANRLGGKITDSAVSNKITRMGLNGRGRVRYRSERKPRKPQERIVGSSEKGSWDSRLVEPWAEFSARRKAERQKMREMCDA